MPALDITNCDLVLPVTEIVIELSDNRVQTFKMLNNSLELNISLDNLVPFTNYSARIFGRNSLGLFTDMNTTLDFTTLQGPPIAPTNVEVGFLFQKYVGIPVIFLTVFMRIGNFETVTLQHYLIFTQIMYIFEGFL